MAIVIGPLPSQWSMSGLPTFLEIKNLEDLLCEDERRNAGHGGFCSICLCNVLQRQALRVYLETSWNQDEHLDVTTIGKIYNLVVCHLCPMESTPHSPRQIAIGSSRHGTVDGGDFFSITQKDGKSL